MLDYLKSAKFTQVNLSKTSQNLWSMSVDYNSLGGAYSAFCPNLCHTFSNLLQHLFQRASDINGAPIRHRWNLYSKSSCVELCTEYVKRNSTSQIKLRTSFSSSRTSVEAGVDLPDIVSFWVICHQLWLQEQKLTLILSNDKREMLPPKDAGAIFKVCVLFNSAHKHQESFLCKTVI